MPQTYRKGDLVQLNRGGKTGQQWQDAEVLMVRADGKLTLRVRDGRRVKRIVRSPVYVRPRPKGGP